MLLFLGIDDLEIMFYKLDLDSLSLSLSLSLYIYIYILHPYEL